MTLFLRLREDSSENLEIYSRELASGRFLVARSNRQNLDRNLGILSDFFTDRFSEVFM